MIIETKEGKHKSVISELELRQELQRRLAVLNPEERKLFQEIMDEMLVAGQEVSDIPCESPSETHDMTRLYQKMVGMHYDRKLISVEEFLLSDDYMGHVGKGLYPQWKEDLAELNSKPYNEVIITGAVGTGKCLDGDTEIEVIGEGLRKIRDIVGRNIIVQTFDGDKIVKGEATVFESGYKKLGSLILKSGKNVRLSGDHPVLTENGWVPVSMVGIGGFVASSMESSLVKTGNNNVDIVPVNNELSKKIRDEVGIPRLEWERKYEVPRGQYMSIGEFLAIKDDYGLPDWCKWWGGVLWDHVESFDEDDLFSPVYDLSVPGTENFVANGIILHNSTFAEIALAYDFYKLCMIRNPQLTFGLLENSEIILVCFNRDEYLARKVTFGGFRAKIELSPFFKKIGVHIKDSSIIYAKKNIEVIAASAKSAKSLGRNVFGGIIDETDFIDGGLVLKDRELAPGEKSIIELLHSNIVRRMKSRFDIAGILPGKLYMTSSAKSSDSFTNRRIGESSTDPGVFCRDYAQYEVKPVEKFAKERFWVRVGNERIPHKILSRREYNALGRAGRRKQEENGCRFIRVPVNFRQDFQRNIEDSIRDIAGITTVSVMPFFQMRGRLYEMLDENLPSPTTTIEWYTNEPLNIRWDHITKRYRKKLGPGQYTDELRPRRHPDAIRFVHLDLSLGAHDPAGIAIGHIVDYITIERRERDGTPFFEDVPLIEMDLVLRILAPPGQEIDFGEIRGIIYDFQRHGYTIGYATMDNFQSRDTLQQLQKHGIDGEVLSVDKTTEPYTELKTAIYEGRLMMYPYQPVVEELERLRRNENARVKIDHPPNGKKDTADALCGVVYSLTSKHVEPGSVVLGISEYEDQRKNTDWIRKDLPSTGEDPPFPIQDDMPVFFMG